MMSVSIDSELVPCLYLASYTTTPIVKVKLLSHIPKKPKISSKPLSHLLLWAGKKTLGRKTQSYGNVYMCHRSHFF